MTITRVGSNEKYAAGWELAFGKGKAKKAASAQTSNKAAPVKKAAAKKVVKTAAKSTSKSPAKKKPAAPKKKSKS